MHGTRIRMSSSSHVSNNKRPTGLNGHLSIRDSIFIDFLSEGLIFAYQQPNHRINKDQHNTEDSSKIMPQYICNRQGSGIENTQLIGKNCIQPKTMGDHIFIQHSLQSALCFCMFGLNPSDSGEVINEFS